MATTSRRRARPPLVRAARQRRPAPTQLSYHRSRAVATLFLFLLGFGLIWMLSGAFTAATIVAVFTTTPEGGWGGHLLVSVIEIAPAVLAPYIRGLPVPARRVIWAISLCAGTFGVFSSAICMGVYFQWTTLTGIVAHIQNTLLAEALEFLPEPMILWLLRALVVALRTEGSGHE